ncbi:MAG: DEAD/DEAH box helicase [Candidatus Eremiobacteraeota bacterium]|nr:DEAD/DEAH box helicase [Candidatus Eremiobacteraeota bacterium]
MRTPRRRAATVRPRKAGSTALPPPTKSEAEFERVLEALKAGTFDTVTEQPQTLVANECNAESSRTSDTAALLDDLFAHRREYLQGDRFATIGEASNFFTKVVGVSFEGRQDIVVGLRGDEAVELVRQPENEKDPNAIQVRYGALQLGFLRKEIARRIAPNMDAGERYTAQISGVTGGRAGKHAGVNLYVRRVRAPSTVRRRESDATQTASADALRVALIGDRRIRDAQERVLERVRQGVSTLAVMGTGRGKSFCFQLPAAESALDRRGKTLVFYPLRALANDQYDVLVRKMEPFGVRIFRANGAIGDEERAELEDALQSGEWDIILSTPEFAEYHREQFTRTWNLPSLVVVDEAHHLYDSRHRPAYGTLGSFIETLGRPQVLALTATASDAAFPHVRRALRIERWVIDPTVRENLHIIDARGRSDTDKVRYIADTLRGDDKAIVYCTSRAEATKIAERLRPSVPGEVAFYHAQVPRDKRVMVEDLFRAGGVQVVAATSAFGEGIDLPDVRHVFLYHLNFNFTEFNQQAGRAGRDGFDAYIHLLYGEGDRRINDYIIAQDAPSIGTLRQLYRGMKGLSGADGLRMTYEDIARTLDLEMVRAEAVSCAVRIFEDAGLVLSGRDDDGRFVRFLETSGKVDLTQTSSFAEGEAIRDSFERFCSLALKADAETLEAIINRPIYPDGVPLLR